MSLFLDRLSNSMRYVVAKMQDGYTLHVGIRRRYTSFLCVPEGGHTRNISMHIIKGLIRRGFIQRVEGARTSTTQQYELTEEGTRQ